MEEESCNRNANLLARYRRPGTSRQELIEAYKAAIKDGDDALADGLSDILDEKYLGWSQVYGNVSISVQDEKITTSVTFYGQSKSFSSAKQAYIWLVEKMLNISSQIDIDDCVFKEMFVNGPKGARYIALSPSELFPDDLSRAQNPNCYHKLSNGWFLNTSLKNKQKRDKIFALAAVCEIDSDDWSWQVEGETDGSLESFDEIIKELELAKSSTEHFASK